MRSFRFLLSRRWALFALAIVVVAWATWWLGNWQFHRLADRKETNSIAGSGVWFSLATTLVPTCPLLRPAP